MKKKQLSIPNYLKNNITWHIIEAASYHICLLAHHVLFFVIAPRELYGAIGTIFSCIYLSTTFLQAGILDTLATFFADYSQSQKQVKNFLFGQLPYNLYLFVIYSIGMYIFSFFLLSSIFTPTILFLTIVAAFFESAKKISKRLLRLANKVPIITGTSIISIILFMVLVWTPFYMFSSQLYVPTVLASLCIMSFFESSINCYYLLKWYKALPSSHIGKTIPNKRVFHSRGNILLMNIGKLAFSGNVLVPFFAATKGLENAALFKFSSSIVHNLIAIIDKVIDRTSIVVFAQNKYQKLSHKTISFFAFAANYNGILCLLLIGFIWYRSYFVFSIFTGSFILYYVLQLIQKTHIPHTKILITQEKSFIVLLITSIQICITALILQLTDSQITVLSSLIVISFLQYIALTYATKHFFNLKKPRFVEALTALLIIFLLQGLFK